MNKKTEEIITEYQSVFVRLTGFTVTSLIFLSGIGRYRVVALYATYSLMDAIFSIKKPIKQIQYIWFPAIILALYLDLTEGPFLPVFSKNYLLLAVPLMLAVDTLARNYVEKIIEQYSEKRLFVVCPSCNYQNEALVEKCTQCGYKSGDMVNTQPMTSHGTKYSIKPKIMRMLNLADNEQILYCLSGSLTSLTIFVNGNRDEILYFVITDHQVIFLDYFRFNIRFVDSWRVKYTVPISEIIRITGKLKKLYLAASPTLGIESSGGDRYEIVFYISEKSKREIKEIANIIAEANPQAEIEIDLPDAPARQSIWE